MSDGLKQRFIDLLEHDAAQAHKAAQAWKELQEQGARLEDAQGKTIATAAEMATSFLEKERELLAFIANVKVA